MHSGMNVNICEPDVSPLQISGPKAGRLIQKLFAGEHDNLGYYKAKETSLEIFRWLSQELVGVVS